MLTVVTEVSHVILKPAGMRMRMSLAAVMLAADGVSVTVICGVAVAPAPTVKVSFVAEEIVGLIEEGGHPGSF